MNLDASADGRRTVWDSLIGVGVIVDTDSSFMYVGKLESVDEQFLTLSGVDVHDMRDSHVTKEIYALEALKYGIRSNRQRTHVRLERVVSVSRLEDVIRY